jgi:uncharacterized protein YecE (DUF72 family)
LAEIALRFRDALEPLRRSGRLGLVLFQFPVGVPIGRETKALIVSLRDLLPHDRIAIEFRNSTWMTPHNRESTLELLRQHGFVYTCVDEPQGFTSSVPPVAAATADLALVRFHGRNAARWNLPVETARERFDYRYSASELAEWVPKVNELASQAERVHVIMNNCFSDHAVTNAAQMAEPLSKGSKEAAA